jgi:hypothetical protein
MQHDLIRLQHMLAAAKDATEFVGGKTRNDLEKILPVSPDSR